MFSIVNPLPNGKILDVTKLKAFADDKLNFAEVTVSVFDRVEKTVGKGENAGYQHFLHFQCFSKPSSLTLSQTSPGFYMSAVRLLKTLWEKEKLLVTSNFSFSHSVFSLFG